MHRTPVHTESAFLTMWLDQVCCLSSSQATSVKNGKWRYESNLLIFPTINVVLKEKAKIPVFLLHHIFHKKICLHEAMYTMLYKEAGKQKSEICQ